MPSAWRLRQPAGMRADPPRTHARDGLASFRAIPTRHTLPLVSSLGGLFERDAELVTLDEAVRMAVAGRGGLLVVEGQAGIGKTSLVEAARRQAGAAGMAVLAAQGARLEQDFGFGVVRQLFEVVLDGADPHERRRVLAGAAGLAAPIVGQADDDGAAPGQQTAMLHGLYWLTSNLAERTPILITVDDVQWSDAPSLRFLAYLARRLEGMPVLLVAALRTGDPPADAMLIAELLGVPDIRVIRPAALSIDGVGRLVRARLDETPDEIFIEACRRATGGVPFLVGELVGLVGTDRIPPTAEAADRIASAGPRTVAQAIMLRLSQLPPPAVTVARAVAVLGRHARLDRVAALENLGAGEVAVAVDALIGMEILAPGRPLAFAHPLVYQAIYDDVPLAARAAAHGRAAEILAGERAPADEVAIHLLLTEPAGRQDVVNTLRAAAGLMLARGAPQSATAYLRRALVEGPAGDERASVMHDLGSSEALAQDPRAAADLEEALCLTADPVTRAVIGAELGRFGMLSGQWIRSLELLRAALADVGDRDPNLRARIEAFAAGRFYDVRFAAEFDLELPGLRALVEEDGPGSRALGLIVAALSACRGEIEPAQALRLVERGLADGRFLREVGSEDLMIGQGVEALIAIDELDAADRASEGVLDDAGRRGSIFGFVAGSSYRVFLDAQRGALKRAEGHLRSLVEVSLKHGIQFTLPGAFYVGLNSLLEREVDDVTTLIESVDPDPALVGSLNGAWVLTARGRLRSLRGDHASAIEDLRAAGALFTGLRFSNPIVALWRSPLALALPAEAAEEARSLVDDELRDATAQDLPRCCGAALRAKGLLEGGDRGIELLEASLQELERPDAILERARTLVELGGALRRGNRRVAARQPLAEGLDLADRCGAERLASRATQELHAAGARPRTRAITGPDSLTASEARVAHMAADGMSNREIAQSLFVTAKTVENQLGTAYRKLGVRSRAELRGALTPAGPS